MEAAASKGIGKSAAKKTKKHVSMSFDLEGTGDDKDDMTMGRFLAKSLESLQSHLFLDLEHLRKLLQVYPFYQENLFVWLHFCNL